MTDVQLFVAEKPSVARDLARVLGAQRRLRGAFGGPQVYVTWCIGHVAELAEPHAYSEAWRAWRKDQLPMVPKRFKLRPNAATADHWTCLSGWLNHPEVTQVVNACDAGREGELIFSFAHELAGCTKPVLRLWLNALTDQAVRAALKAMRPGRAYAPLADAARCRAEADWLVGLNATRALTLARRSSRAPSALFTVGRVQTPTLAMLVAREQAIEAFEPEPYWQVQCTLDGGPTSRGEAAAGATEPQADGTPAPGATGGTAHRAHRAHRAQPPPQQQQQQQQQAAAFTALYTHPVREDGKKVQSHRIGSEAQAQAIARSIEGEQGRIARVVHKVHEELPPLLHDLTGLQRLANLRHGMTAQETLQAAQGLYEQHKAITYPRTDSNYLPGTLAASLGPLLQRLRTGTFGALVAPVLPEGGGVPQLNLKRIVKDSEVSDHHAIIPTGKPPPPMAASLHEHKIYELIVRRFIAAFYPPARIALGTLEAQVAGHVFVGRGRMVLDLGWQAVEPQADGGRNDKLLPTYHRGDGVTVVAARIEAQKTRPPPRLSEASLLGAMERAGTGMEAQEVRLALKDQGLGTPATRAAIIENLKRRAYVQVEGRTLLPSPEGRALLQALPVDALKSAELTGRWEAKLSDVARGRLPRATFMADIHAFVGTMVQEILATSVVSQDAPAAGPEGGGAQEKATRTPPHRPLSDTRTRKHKAGACPVCGEAQVRRGDALACAGGRACTFVIFAQVAGRTLTPTEIKQLVAGKRTATLKGFTSRAGKAFAAQLELNEHGRVAFVFDNART